MHGEQWAMGAAYRLAERLAIDPAQLGELLREEVSAHFERLLSP
jgi:hypothetical protein